MKTEKIKCSMVAHTPTEWVIQPLSEEFMITSKYGDICAMVDRPEIRANAELIVRAVNNHKSMLATLKMLDRCDHESRADVGKHYLSDKCIICPVIKQVEADYKPPMFD